MKKLVLFASMAVAVAMTVACGGKSSGEDDEESVELTNSVDSLSYSVGISLANELQQYHVLTDQLGVDTTCMDNFYEGLNEAVKDDIAGKNKARYAGLQLANQLVNQVFPYMNQRFFAGDSLGSIDQKEVMNAMTDFLKGTVNMTKEQATEIMDSFAIGKDVKELNRAIGVSLGSELKEYDVLGQQGLEEKDMDACLDGMKEILDHDKNDPKQNAYFSGIVIGIQLVKGILPSQDQRYFGDDSTKTISRRHVLDALVTSIKGEKAKMTVDDAQKFQEDFMKKLIEEKNGPNKKAGEDFLKENKTKEGVVTTASGLQYKVLKEANGQKPAASDKVKVHYEGRLIDGTVFDSSIARGEPAVFGVSQVIPGWVEALQLMPVGSEWELYIPQELAYGERGAGQLIPPFSALIFKVQLLGIEK